MSYKRIYLTSGSILLIFALITPFIEYYYGYEDIVYCNEKCWVDFCLKNGNKDLYFYNKGELPLTFEPEGKVSNVKFFKKDGRQKSGYREIDFISPYSKGVSYVFKIDAYKPSCYAMEIIKEPSANLKWAFGKLDPWLISTLQGNMSYDVHSCYNTTRGLGDCFAVNMSIAYNQINWSDNRTINGGNFSWNFTETGILPVGGWLFNFTNNGTTNITVKIKLNHTNPTRWQLFYNQTIITQNTTNYSICYQESTNSNGSAYCGGLSSGKYSCQGSWTLGGECELTYDEDWTTGGEGEGDNVATHYANYSLPSNSLSGVWQVAEGGNCETKENLSINSSCIKNPVEFKVIVHTPDATTLINYSCFNSTNWILMKQSGTTPNLFCEGGVYWDISSTTYTYVLGGGVNLTSTSFVNFVNVTTNISRRINLTLNLYNISQSYANWSLQSSTAEWSFNYTLNISSY